MKMLPQCRAFTLFVLRGLSHPISSVYFTSASSWRLPYSSYGKLVRNILRHSCQGGGSCALSTRRHCHRSTANVSSAQPLSDVRPGSDFLNTEFDEPELDWSYICDLRNKDAIQQNIINRKGVGNIDLVHELWRKLEDLKSKTKPSTTAEFKALRKALIDAASDLPNQSHPDVPVGDESNAIQVAECGTQNEFSHEPVSAVNLAEDLGILRTQFVGLATGPRTYYLKNDLAYLEEALVNYTLDVLLKKNFSLISVPDLVSTDVIEGCGFKTTGVRTQVYKLKKERHGDFCLAGTGEIPIAGFFKNQELKLSDFPKRVCTISRCYRAEAGEIEIERGLYRVHQFTKVEMFGVTEDETGQESDLLLKEILDIQKETFEGLGLHFRILDMPSQELGAPAYRKFDMEAWMCARKFWGEISSASNCTDYQSRRLRIKYLNANGNHRYCHTVNGTACAVPRLLIAILEGYQNSDGSVSIPDRLKPYMNISELNKKGKSSDNLRPLSNYHYGSRPGSVI